MKAHLIYSALVARWGRFGTLHETERSALVEAVASLCNEAVQQDRKERPALPRHEGDPDWDGYAAWRGL